MPLKDFIASLRPEGTFDVWVAALAEVNQPVSRASLEHYVSGRRRPEAEMFASLLVAAGRARGDRDAWRIWGAAVGMPDAVIEPSQGAA